MRTKKSVERTLKDIIAYRDGLGKRSDRELATALDRVVDVVQNHLYHAYLDIRDFYETTLLSQALPPNVKAEMARDIAGRWEQMDLSSSTLSTSYTHSTEHSTEFTSGARSRSFSHIPKPVALKSEAIMENISTERMPAMTRSFGRLNLTQCQRHKSHSSSNNQKQHVKEDKETLRDDNDEERFQSPSLGSSSVSCSSSLRQQSSSSSIFRVQLKQGPQGFGFSVAGGTDQEPSSPTIDRRFVYVARITPGGVADSDGRLRVNDILLSVNGFGLVGLPHLKAVTLFEQSGSLLDLEVQRPPQVCIQKTGRPEHSLMSPQISVAEGRCIRTFRSHVDDGGGAEPQVMPTRSRLTALSRSHCIILPATSNSPSSTESSDPLPTTVSPLSSSFTTCPNPLVSSIPKGSSAAENKAEDDDTTIWPFDPEQISCEMSVSYTASHLSSQDLEAHAKCGSFSLGVEDNAPSKLILESAKKSTHRAKNLFSTISFDLDQRDLSSRPKPDPPPGPVIVEVPLVRGTSTGFGFSIAGGVDAEFLKGDSGIFITQVTPGGVADTDGRIAVGDRLVRVNSVSLVDVTHAEAVEALQNAGDFALLFLVKVPLQASLQQINCRQCQAIQNLCDSSNASTNHEGKIPDRQPPRASAEEMADNGSPHQRKSKRRPTSQPHRPAALIPSKSTAEALPLSNSSTGSEDYAAAHAVPESILRRWPRARLVTLYKSEVAIAGCSGGGRRNGSTGERSGGSLGFNIVGSDVTDGIYVSHIHPDRPAARVMSIFVGDRLLAINGVEVVDLTHEQAAILLKTASSRVDLVLSSDPIGYKKLEDRIREQAQAQSNDGTGGEVTMEEDECDENEVPLRPSHFVEADGLFVRLLADFDPQESIELNQVIRRSAISIQSGDILQLINTTHPEWWQARIIHPSTCKPIGLTGLVPSRCRLERYERSKWSIRLGLGSHPPGVSSSEKTSSLLSDPQSTDKAIKSIPLSQSDVSTSSSKRSFVSKEQQRSTESARVAKMSFSGRARSEFTCEFLPPTYVPVISQRVVYTRPVIILGDLNCMSDDLLLKYPDDFGTCVPHTTRHRRHGEVEGRDYHFVKVRSEMESDIQLNRYVEAGEYNGNLYGVHLHSVFKVAFSGLHCLLDVGAAALQRLTVAGLSPIAIFVLSDLPSQSLSVIDPNGSISAQKEINPSRQSKRLRKNLTNLNEYSPYLTAILIIDDLDKGAARIHKIVQDNKGPNVWIASSDCLP